MYNLYPLVWLLSGKFMVVICIKDKRIKGFSWILQVFLTEMKISYI